VLPAWRPRGAAAALTSTLAALNGATQTVMLMAADEAERRIYARAAFTVVAEITLISATA